MLDEILEGAAEVAAEAGGKLAEAAVELAGETVDVIASAAEFVTEIPDSSTGKDEKEEQKS